MADAVLLGVVNPITRQEGDLAVRVQEMVEGALFNVANEIIRKAGDVAVQEIALIWGVNDEIKKLKETVSTISAVLLDAEAKRRNNVVRLWLQRLKDPMLDADDLLDEISTEALRWEVMTRDKKAKEVRILFSKFNQLAYGLRMGHKVKAMRERFDALTADRKFHLDERSEEEQVRYNAREQTYSLVRAEDVIGREDDKKAIIESLLDCANAEENVSVLPIIGIAGLGKTTVAKLVFNDEQIKNHFELKLWVGVSVDFDVKIIVEKIMVQCVKNKKPEYLEMNTLVNDLQKEINGKRYLLVLDNVWNEDRDKWFSLKAILKGAKRGSGILLTTRSEGVVAITQSKQPHKLKGLDDQQSLSLFKKMAFKEGEPKSASFVEIGKEILKKCVGVPLAIRIIGECSYRIDKSSLINMWMAHGFIMLYGEKQCLEDVGHEYFMDLLRRSFFQEVEEDELGNISKFKIHDLMHDMATLVMGLERTSVYSKKSYIDEQTRHVSFGYPLHSSSKIPISLYRARRIKTFLLPCQQWYVTANLDSLTYSAIVASFKFIRLLDLHNMGIKTIPSSIKKLKYLRYIDLSGNKEIEMLPNSIVKLYNLQTLKLSECDKLKELPRDINKLVNLRFLEIDMCLGLTYMPNGLGQLTNLQTLSRFVMSKSRIDSVPKSYGGLKELGKLNELRGNLSIEFLKHEKDAALECKDANLKEKRLDRLDLEWIEEDINETGAGYDDKSLEALQPHLNLKALSLVEFGGVIFPHWFLSLTNLVQFKLDSCKKCQYLPPLDQIPSLKIIGLNGLDCLEHISNSEGDHCDSLFYPSLERLTISNCPNLKGWWQGRRDSLPSFPRLSDLTISNCPQLTSFPLFPYLKTLELYNCSLKQSLERMMINKKTSSGNLPSIASSSSSSTIVAPLSKLSFMRIEEALLEECLPNLISLRSLYLVKLKCPLPQGMQYLTALQHLRVWESEVVDLFNDWDEMEWQGLTTLLSLSFRELPKLVSLPMGLQHVSSLQELHIKNCPKLESLPEGIGALTSLQTLHIGNCPNLTSLPEGIGALTSLQTLYIGGCPILLKRCKEQIGEYWHKISHIPNLEGELSRQEEQPDEEAKKPAHKNWDLIKAFGCCNCSTTQQLTH